MASTTCKYEVLPWGLEWPQFISEPVHVRFVYTYQKQPFVCLRFIDDIFFIWQYGQDELDNFVQHLNSVHNTIKFTCEHSLTSVNFLDTVVSVEENRSLKTRLYVKPTDSASYLHYQSAHPRHCIKGIPYGQFLRIRRICTDDSDSGYPAHFVANAFYHASQHTRESLLSPKPGENKGEVPNILVTTYNPGFNGLNKVVARNWDILGKSCSTRGIHRIPLLNALRRTKNLKAYW